MRGALSLATIVVALAAPALFGADQRARTEDGKEVILHDDGTWSYVDKNKGKKAGQKSSEIYKGKRGTFAIALTPGTWKKAEKPSNPVVEAEFAHKDGDVMAMVVAERISVPPAVLKEAFLGNMKRAGGEARIVEEMPRKVNGNEVLFLTIDAQVKGIPLTYMCYLYSGDAGSIQIITFTGQNLFKTYQKDMEALLNGFETIKQE